MIAGRRFRAPERHGDILAEPPLDQVCSLLRHNREIFTSNVSILGKPLSELRQEARRSALSAAREYLLQAGEPLPEAGTIDVPETLLLSGHQPELFHPGVWIKNFVLHGLARLHHATALNLVVDSDSARSTVLHLPVWDGTEPTPACDPRKVRRLAIAFDRWTGELPFEERKVNDAGLFAGLADQAAGYFRRWGFKPILPDFWNEVLKQSKRTDLLGERFVAARRTLERRWGCHNLEVPISQVCRTEPFAWFACHILSDLLRFHALYNESVHEYRRLHGIRSRFHPVPDLVEESGWLETPFWVWRADRPKRERLLAKVDDSKIALRMGGETGPTVPLPTCNDPLAAVNAWLNLERLGWKIRSRALTTTLFARLFLADLFIHGIGGAKYDELTDEIMRRFYGIVPPGYLTLSATWLLPFASYPSGSEACSRLAHDIHDLDGNPQRHLDRAVSEALAHSAEKRRWIAEAPADARGRRDRFKALADITRRLRSYVEEDRQSLVKSLERSRLEVHANGILQRRDYAFCLYPEETLRRFLSGMSCVHVGQPFQADMQAKSGWKA